MAKARIAIATFGRSDFSILRPLATKLFDDPRFDVGWWVAGAHFDESSGRTFDEVANSGVPIWGTVDCAMSGRSELDTVRSMSCHVDGFGRLAAGVAGAPTTLIEGSLPDLMIILGDRFEAVSAGLAMVPMRLPVAHISGGSVTEGAIDDVFRHCLTKIAAIHFCDLPEFAQRIQRMGEPPERIFTTGALGLDGFVDLPPQPFAELVERFGFDGLTPGFVLANLHPESQRPEVNTPMARSLIEALDRFGHQVVFTHPNVDPGSDQILAEIVGAAVERGWFVVPSFGAAWYPSAMSHAGCMVGNSSGGIIEAASFQLPVVDIGARQGGRTHGPNVMHCGRSEGEILDAMLTVTGPSFRACAEAPNIYGDGHAADRVIDVLAGTDLSILRQPKTFSPPAEGFTGDRRAWP